MLIADRPLKVLIGFECSGVVRRQFELLGHDVWSCDLKPAMDKTNRHIRDDIRNVLAWGWDLLAVLHPPCTRLCNSGVRWLTEPPTKLNPEHHTPDECAAYLLMDRDERLAFMWDALRKGADLFSAAWNASIKRKVIENPVMHKHAKSLIVNYRDAAQHVQPHWFGDPFFKSTGLYLDGLPPLKRTHWLDVPKAGTAEHKQWSAVHQATPGPNRSEIRSTFFEGMARAFAAQWGGYAREQEMLRAA